MRQSLLCPNVRISPEHVSCAAVFPEPPPLPLQLPSSRHRPLCIRRGLPKEILLDPQAAPAEHTGRPCLSKSLHGRPDGLLPPELQCGRKRCRSRRQRWGARGGGRSCRCQPGTVQLQTHCSLVGGVLPANQTAINLSTSCPQSLEFPVSCCQSLRACSHSGVQHECKDDRQVASQLIRVLPSGVHLPASAPVWHYFVSRCCYNSSHDITMSAPGRRATGTATSCERWACWVSEGSRCTL